ncbi:MAG: glycosyltransferase family 39 protein [Anaerolineae bacterium]|nr:glycosyltransferase family 39 protein [Anaerolineae bacterium]
MRKRPVRFISHFLRPLCACWLLFALLTLTLDAQSLWWDEGISLHLASVSWKEVVLNRAANIHPPLYFFALKLWTGLAGRTPFAARYLSALALTLLPAAAYTFMRLRVDRRTGRVAALLLALSPLFFIYGQEVRAYAFLPLLALALLAQIWPRKGHLPSPAYGRTWLLALTQAAFVLTHYAGVIAVAWANLVLFVRCVRAGDRHLWRRWLLGAALTALLMLPWGVAVLRAWTLGYRNDAGLSNVLDAPLPADYFLRLIAIFQAVGLPTAMSDAGLFRPALFAGGLLVFSLVYCLVRRLRGAASGFQPVSLLFLVWALSMSVAPLIWMLSPQSHPRYLLPFVLAGWLLASALVASREVNILLRGALLAALLAMSVLGLRAYLTNPAYARSDVRSAATYLRQKAQPGDVVLVPYTDWSLEQYPLGAANPVMLPPSADDAAVAELLARVAQPGRQVYVLDYGRVALDPRGQVRTLLEWGGYLAARYDFPGVYLQSYTVYTSAIVTFDDDTTLFPACVAAISPCLTGAALEPYPDGGAALPVLLRWEGMSVVRYSVGLRVYAPSGALVASRDDLLLDAGLRPSELWSGAPVTTYHLIPLPAGLPPRPYRVEVGVYATDAPATPLSLARVGAPPTPNLALGVVTPTLASALATSAYRLPDGPVAPTAFGPPGPTLLGAALDRALVYAGQPFFVTLRWQTGPAEQTLPEPVLQMYQNGRLLVETPALVDLPALPEGRLVLEHLVLTVPPDAVDGEASVALLSGDQEVWLGTVELSVGEHVFVAPAMPHLLDAGAGDLATLLGYDLAPEPPLRNGAPVTLTLFWKSGARVTGDWTVFVHLVGQDGAIVAQHDGKPSEGTRATTSWIPDEIVEDRHVLVWQRPCAGPTSLRVGFYDPTTGMRVSWDDGRDAWILADALPVE